MNIADKTDSVKFSAELQAHQRGETDFLTFIKMCAETGIERWEICLSKMTCTYFNKAGEVVLSEQIPE